MKFIVGLGNPGLEYKATRHNIGFNVVKNLAKEYGIKINEKRHYSLIGKGKIAGEEIGLVLPQTYMNLSGRAVGELFSHEMKDALARKGGVNPAHSMNSFGNRRISGVKDVKDLLVVCDDINIELGRIRLKKRGSAGGHKGLESIIHTIGTDDFARLKVGIATEAHKGDITGYVLSPFKRKEMRNVSHIITLATDAITYMIKNGVEAAMTKFNKAKIGTS